MSHPSENPPLGNGGQEPATIHTTQHSPARPDPAPSQLARALKLAAWGFEVHPLKGKIPILSAWQKRTTTDPATITRWWRQWPTANIGCQPPEWAVVLDIDPRNGGEVTWENINGAPDYPTDTLVVRTGSGGAHVWYRLPYHAEFNTLVGIDLQRRGKQVVMPGSTHPATGKLYVAVNWCDPAVLPVLPVHLHRRVFKPARPARPQLPVNLQRKGNGAHLVRFMEQASEGKRNEVLNWCAYKAAQEGFNLFEGLAAAAEAVGLGAPEIDRTIISARRAGEAKRGAA